MTMGDQDMVGSGHLIDIRAERCKILEKPAEAEKDRIDQEILVQILNHNTGMFEICDGQPAVQLDRFPVYGQGLDLFFIVETLKTVLMK